MKYLIYLMFPISIGLPLNRQNVFDAVNFQRQAHIVPLVTNNPLLNIAATSKAKYIAATQEFTHSFNGQNIWRFINSTGYQYEIVGEVLAENYTDPVKIAQAWIDSPEHKNIILSKQYTEAGVGIACTDWVAANISHGTCYIVMEFAKPKK